MLIQILLCLWLCISLKLCVFINRKVDKYRRMQNIHSPELNEEFKMFIRNDSFQMNKGKMFISAFLLFLPRLVLLVIGWSIGFICYLLVSFMPYGVFRRVFLKVSSYLSGRFLFHSQGYHYVSEETLHPSCFFPLYPKQHIVNDPPIIIGNHVTYLDVFYICTRYACGFLAKKEEKKVYAFKTAGEAFGAIWVDRSSTTEKNNVISQIQERVQEYTGSCSSPANPKRRGPLLIFPEGTTSNGRHLLSLKQGAFVSLAPLKVVCLDYSQPNYQNFLDNEGSLTNMIFTMCQIYNTLKVTVIPSLDPLYLVDPNADQQTQVTQFTQKSKQLMAHVLGIQMTDAGYSHNQVYTMMYQNHFKITQEEATKRVNDKYNNRNYK